MASQQNNDEGILYRTDDSIMIVPSDVPTNSIVTPLKDVVEKVLRWNDPKEIAAYIDRAALATIPVETKHQTTNIVIANSDAPYSDSGYLMIAAFNDAIIYRPDIYQGVTIYDCDLLVQSKYWAATLQALRAFMDTRKDGEYVIAMENTTSRLSTEQERMCRSTGYPHIHVMQAEISSMAPRTEPLHEHLQVEREIMQLPDFEDLTQWVSLETAVRMKSTTVPDIIKPRKNYLPLGYEAVLKIGKGQLDIAYLRDFMLEHHEAYSRAIGDFIPCPEVQAILNAHPDMQIKSQPSYRTYLLFDNQGLLHIIFSPIIVSSAGTPDAAGIELQRDHNLQSRYATPQERRDAHRSIAERVATEVSEIFV